MMSRRIGVAIGIMVAVVLMGIGDGLQRERSTNQHIQVALAEATNDLVLAAQMKLGPSTGNTLVTRGTRSWRLRAFCKALRLGLRAQASAIWRVLLLYCLRTPTFWNLMIIGLNRFAVV